MRTPHREVIAARRIAAATMATLCALLLIDVIRPGSLNPRVSNGAPITQQLPE